MTNNIERESPQIVNNNDLERDQINLEIDFTELRECLKYLDIDSMPKIHTIDEGWVNFHIPSNKL